MNAAVEVENLSHAFDGRTVLEELSFPVPAGCFFTIIGPNGSGKTTLLKLMVGLLGPRTGRVAVLGRSIDTYTARQLARTIAYVPQNVPLTFAFTVGQVVLMGRAPHLGLLGLEGESDLRLAREAMALADVAHLADRRLDQLSGGEQQRVFIARAICQQPKILLLDEPTAALDLSHQVAVMDLMERLKTHQGITIVMVSHDLNLAAMYADLILLLDKGRLAGLGAPREVLDFALLEKVYGCPLLVDKSPLGDYPRVHLVPGRYLAPRSS
ncbi:MAG: ABC transporter ATP-binding protein [Desulfatitalea sp.]